jgi:heme exporter protein B
MRPTEAALWLRSAGTVFRKDWRSELRTRYAVSALLMFVVTTIAIILFSLGEEAAPIEALAGMLWVVIFFTAMSGLARTFVMEEERGTAMTLQLTTSPSAVFCGKLVFNLVLLLGVNAVVVALYAILVAGFVIKSMGVFLLTIFLGSMGFAVAATVIAAIIARANTKGTLYPVLSFPIVLPLLLTVIDATRVAATGGGFVEAQGDFQLLTSYIVVVTVLSLMLFDYIWKD